MHGGNPYVLRQICVKAKKETLGTLTVPTGGDRNNYLVESWSIISRFPDFIRYRLSSVFA